MEIGLAFCWLKFVLASFFFGWGVGAYLGPGDPKGLDGSGLFSSVRELEFGKGSCIPDDPLPEK